MRPDEMRARVAAARVARLATVRPDGAPHVVTITFAVFGEHVASAVDHKTKRTTDLQRLTNIGAEPRAALLVDSYDDEWRALWWVRIDAVASVIGAESPLHADAVAALVAKYAQYRQRPPSGAIILLEPVRWTGWSI
jgi:PPOX class probable F420-dependent enzyme